MLVQKRPPKGLLGGMTEFPGSDWRTGFDPASALENPPLAARYIQLPGDVLHVFSHFSLSLTVFAAQVPSATPAPGAAFWVAARELDDLALPSLMRKVLARARENS